MRTTVEISAEQHRALSAVAQRRGLRGFSTLVQEALDAYLSDLSAEEVHFLLGLQGSVTDEEADAMRERISESRGSWRAS